MLPALLGTPAAGQPLPPAGADFQWQLTGDFLPSVDADVLDLERTC